ncbi:MAG: hypothetical protein ACREFD_12975 [Stellaceae bacterium]
MKRLAVAFGVALAAGAMLSSVRAAQADALYKSLLVGGYEIKSVVVLNSDFTSHFGNKLDNNYTVLVTLQKGSSSAACYFYIKDWINQTLSKRTCAVFK